MINIISRSLNKRAISNALNGAEKKFEDQLQKLFLIQSRNICHKNDLDPTQVALRLPPYPYKTRRYTWFERLTRMEGYNQTMDKFTENTKVVVVEGNVSCGKEPLGKKLAEHLGMVYFPDVTPEMDYKYDDGYDLRELNFLLHEDVKYPDFKSVLETKNPYQAAYWELALLRLRTYNYLQALTHLLNTGDGVVLERSAWSGTVFARTALDMNFVGPSYLEHYWEVRSNVLTKMLRPHILVYLDVPVDKCLENARIRNTHGTGELLSEEYLESVEKNYKTHFLPKIEKHAELFTYKLNEAVTDETANDLSERIIDDFSRSNMDEYFMNVTANEEKFDDWRFFDSDERFTILRYKITNNKQQFLDPFEFYPYYIDELWPSYSLLYARDHVYEKQMQKREDKKWADKSIMQKIFEFRRKTWEEKDKEDWLITTGYPPDHIQADR